MGITNYIKETRAELKHVSWPTRKQAIGYTVVVVVFSLAVALYLGVLDYLLSIPLQTLL